MTLSVGRHFPTWLHVFPSSFVSRLPPWFHWIFSRVFEYIWCPIVFLRFIPSSRIYLIFYLVSSSTDEASFEARQHTIQMMYTFLYSRYLYLSRNLDKRGSGKRKVSQMMKYFFDSTLLSTMVLIPFAHFYYEGRATCLIFKSILSHSSFHFSFFSNSFSLSPSLQRWGRYSAASPTPSSWPSSCSSHSPCCWSQAHPSSRLTFIFYSLALFLSSFFLLLTVATLLLSISYVLLKGGWWKGPLTSIWILRQLAAP